MILWEQAIPLESIGESAGSVAIMLSFGFRVFRYLPIPEIEPPVAAVATNYEGAGPEEIESSVTEPMEEQLSTIEGLDRMTSQSEEGTSLVLLELSWSTSVEDVQQEINNAMNNANLPDDAGIALRWSRDF